MSGRNTGYLEEILHDGFKGMITQMGKTIRDISALLCCFISMLLVEKKEFVVFRKCEK